ncbi:recQ-mediated genome instability protein 1-like isoform X2 [Linepithema humile]|uniref:recQ-mediated genome instability protein 1-like isoform X2 n=1 Tax=Linepithema humile TaxID=83485 RepID=UPI0006230F18|nr:PREDICTED: recQ-mediated genome instability protein 1-like isoform X2 [Linepithema humile]
MSTKKSGTTGAHCTDWHLHSSTQVDKMYDIASSKYKQLCEIRKINTKNIEAIEKENSTEWEPKGRRMMQLCLTDGVQDLIAIEYTSLKQLTSTLLPGYKVMIIGPVDCRRGVILLQDGKYKEIGGEIESLLKPNALENVLARALDEPENPDPYNDNGPPRIPNRNVQSAPSNPSNDSFFDDDFEENIDFVAVTEIERRSQESEAVQDRVKSTSDQKETEMATEEAMETFLEDIDFEPFENWPSDSPRPLRVLPASPESERIEQKDDIMIVEEESAPARDSHNACPASSFKDSISEFPDDDFDFNDIIIKTEKSQQDRLKTEIKTCFTPPNPKSKLPNLDVPIKIEKYIVKKENKESMMDTKSTIRQTPKAEMIVNSSVLPSKSCDVLSDVLREPIIGRMYRTVRGQVKNHSALSKQGRCWAVTAVIADHTSSVEVCFDSEILERFLGFTVQEFSQKKKLAKSDPRMNNELRLSLRKAQHQIQNLDALLKLELIRGEMPKVVDITQLTQQQKNDLMKKST